MRLIVLLCVVTSAMLPAAAWAQRGEGSPRPERRSELRTLERQTLEHGGETRGYYLHVPARLARSGARVPLVIDLHGGGGNGRIAATMTGFAQKAEREGFIAVFPDGSGRLEDKLLTWNAGHCCAGAMRAGADDVGFIRALIDRLVRELPVDPQRVYATGMSNGAMMAHRLGIALPDRIAAIAPVVGGLFGDEPRPAGPVAALIINGAQDKAVPLEGGPLGGRVSRAADAPLRPAAHQGAFWAAANGCNPAPREERLGAAVVVHRYACPAGREVVRYVVLDGGHAWPGGRRGTPRADAPSASLDATDVVWDFFRTKRLAAR